ncbi:CDP-alcohol phosphatidyltransferase family protein [Chlamydia ibidis]|uniref:CDP-alcohol phosphatidyltransferase family protein n=2 Tax=Chlamydia ibidis TaxID=1405396 RepID=S7J3V2_9CHLA|nr:phosphatidylcholine/phosphatidylserine synthase [Chlamydia ibidis]EPP34687.1 CDP-alcohol phosphatidyltransferase family protein [Chlamydia ibidis]EQM62506.1 CDP-alcohol phosphatidyltransferase family protein [Chlamydia ibidis 10-1398/6]
MTGSETEFRGKRRVVTPNAITAFGLCCGLFIIFKSVLKTNSSIELLHRLQGLSLLLISAMIADFSDGAVARIMKAESAFGAHFDSLSDAVTFGIAPPLIVIKSLDGVYGGGFLSSLLLVASIIYSLCGVLRLVRYNLFSKDPSDASRSTCFIGLPIPSGAAAVVSLALLLASDFSTILPIEVRVILLSLGLLFIGSLMISPWKFPSLKNFRFRVSSFLLVVSIGLVACLFFLGLVDHFTEVFFLASWLYVFIVFPIFAITHRKNRIKKLP